MAHFCYSQVLLNNIETQTASNFTSLKNTSALLLLDGDVVYQIKNIPFKSVVRLA